MLVICDEDNNVILDKDKIIISPWIINNAVPSIVYEKVLKLAQTKYLDDNVGLSLVFTQDNYISITNRPDNYSQTFFTNILHNEAKERLKRISFTNIFETDNVNELHKTTYEPSDGNGILSGTIDLTVLHKVNGINLSLTGNISSNIQNTGRAIIALLTCIHDRAFFFKYDADQQESNTYIVPRQIINTDSSGSSHVVSHISIVDRAAISVNSYLNGVDIRVARQWSNVGVFIPDYSIDTLGVITTDEAIEATLNASTSSDVVKTKNAQSIINDIDTKDNTLNNFYKLNKSKFPISQRCQHYIIFPSNVISGLHFQNIREKLSANYLYIKAIYGKKLGNEFSDIQVDSIQGIGAVKLTNSPDTNNNNLEHGAFAMHTLKPGSENYSIIGFQIVVTKQPLENYVSKRNPGNWQDVDHINLYSGREKSYVNTRKCFVYSQFINPLSYNEIRNKVYPIATVEFCSQVSEFATGFNGNTELDSNNLPRFDVFDYTSSDITKSFHQRAWVVKTFELTSDRWQSSEIPDNS